MGLWDGRLPAWGVKPGRFTFCPISPGQGHLVLTGDWIAPRALLDLGKQERQDHCKLESALLGLAGWQGRPRIMGSRFRGRVATSSGKLGIAALN